MQIVRPAKPSGDYLYTLARVREAQGQPSVAQELLAQALKLEPKAYNALLDSARLAEGAGHWDSAADPLRRADERAPDRPEGLVKLVGSRLKCRRPGAAVGTAHTT